MAHHIAFDWQHRRQANQEKNLFLLKQGYADVAFIMCDVLQLKIYLQLQSNGNSISLLNEH